MRGELILQTMQAAMDDVFGPHLTLRDFCSTIRDVMRNEPMKGEMMVGRLYGRAFLQADAKYEAARGHRIGPRLI